MKQVSMMIVRVVGNIVHVVRTEVEVAVGLRTSLYPWVPLLKDINRRASGEEVRPPPEDHHHSCVNPPILTYEEDGWMVGGEMEREKEREIGEGEQELSLMLTLFVLLHPPRTPTEPQKGRTPVMIAITRKRSGEEERIIITLDFDLYHTNEMGAAE